MPGEYVDLVDYWATDEVCGRGHMLVGRNADRSGTGSRPQCRACQTALEALHKEGLPAIEANVRPLANIAYSTLLRGRYDTALQILREKYAEAVGVLVDDVHPVHPPRGMNE